MSAGCLLCNHNTSVLSLDAWVTGTTTKMPLSSLWYEEACTSGFVVIGCKGVLGYGDQQEGWLWLQSRKCSDGPPLALGKAVPCRNQYWIFRMPPSLSAEKSDRVDPLKPWGEPLESELGKNVFSDWASSNWAEDNRDRLEQGGKVGRQSVWESIRGLSWSLWPPVCQITVALGSGRMGDLIGKGTWCGEFLLHANQYCIRANPWEGEGYWLFPFVSFWGKAKNTKCEEVTFGSALILKTLLLYGRKGLVFACSKSFSAASETCPVLWVHAWGTGSPPRTSAYPLL